MTSQETIDHVLKAIRETAAALDSYSEAYADTRPKFAKSLEYYKECLYYNADRMEETWKSATGGVE